MKAHNYKALKQLARALKLKLNKDRNRTTILVYKGDVCIHTCNSFNELYDYLNTYKE